jgi:hypothetical protein
VKPIFAIILLAFFISSAFANNSYYPSAYDSKIESGELKDGTLKDVLYKILSSRHLSEDGKNDVLVATCPVGKKCYGHDPVSYSEARKHLFGSIHLKKDANGYFVRGVYCDKDFRQSDFRSNSGPGPMRIPDNNVMNCEHTWPKSKFNRNQPYEYQVTDLHHLFPTDSKANSVRSSYPFGEVVDGESAHSDCTSARIGYTAEQGKKWNSVRGYGYDYAFEPPDYHKGNVARALFYFSVRYKININQHEEAFLRKWNELDPIDEFEIWRNNEVMKIQGDRNPFIDYPNLVNSIQDF